MRVVVIGATGTIGAAVADALAERHEVVRVGNRSGELTVDMASAESVDALFREVGRFDALVSAAGAARFKPLAELGDEDFNFSLANKLMGQVDLVRRGLAQVADGGSFTLTSGVLSTEPMPGSAAISLVNAGLEGFARAAALELPRGAGQCRFPAVGERNAAGDGARPVHRAAGLAGGAGVRAQRGGGGERGGDRRAAGGVADPSAARRERRDA